MNPEVDQYLLNGCMRCPLGASPECKVNSWLPELNKLREIILDCNFTEELKWGVPCYTFQGKNVILLSAFKNFAAISFFKGVLLSDEKKLLIAPGPNSQSSRYLKYTSLKEIIEKEPIIRAYLLEAVEIEKQGLNVSFEKNPEPIPEELQNKMHSDPVFQDAFEALSPGRQRGYIIHFSQAKQSKTRISRIEKMTPKILNGEGMHDHYKSRYRNN